jgi:hypothetical protein
MQNGSLCRPQRKKSDGVSRIIDNRIFRNVSITFETEGMRLNTEGGPPFMDCDSLLS